MGAISRQVAGRYDNELSFRWSNSTALSVRR